MSVDAIDQESSDEVMVDSLVKLCLNLMSVLLNVC